jgi:phosphatidylglycerophosphate synthase
VRWRSLLTVPNLLSLTRLPLAAGFLVADGTTARVALVGVASATDLLDGWLARRTGRTTKWGALLDPIADKAFMLAALTAFLLRGDLGAGDFFLVLVRDVATLVGFGVGLLMSGVGAGDYQARWSGKVVTVLQLALIVALLLAPAVVPALVFATGLASIYAIGDYTIALALVRARRQRAG